MRERSGLREDRTAMSSCKMDYGRIAAPLLSSACPARKQCDSEGLETNPPSHDPRSRGGDG